MIGFETARTAAQIRSFEKLLYAKIRAGETKAGATHSSLGHEWAASSVAQHLTGADWVFPYYRSHSWLLARGCDPTSLASQILSPDAPGSQMHLGCRKHNVQPANAYVGQHLPLACGFAWRLSQGSSGGLVVVSLGDGALTTGIAFETLLMAERQHAPLVFCLEDNGVQNYGVSASVAEEFDLEQMVRSTGVQYLRTFSEQRPLDLGVVHRAVQHVRSAGGPVLLHFRVELGHPHSYDAMSEVAAGDVKLNDRSDDTPFLKIADTVLERQSELGAIRDILTQVPLIRDALC